MPAVTTGDRFLELVRKSGVLEPDATCQCREDGVVTPQARARTREEGHPTLADDDGAGRHQLAVSGLHAETLTGAVATIP